VEATGHPLDPQFPEWGESPYFSVTIGGTKTLSELLTHLYVLIPVFDNGKHYFVGEDEVEKLLAKGEGWLSEHPEKEQITRRYLRHRPNLYREALARLVDDEIDADDDDDLAVCHQPEEGLETPLSLNEQRHGTVLAVLKASGAHSILDLGCGEGKLLRQLIAERQFERVVGMDVSIRSLEIAQRQLKLDQFSERHAERIKLIHGSLMYRDQRLTGFDAAAVVEVIEHLDPPRLSALERVLFEFARPKSVVMTTPNQEYNANWESLPAGKFRHADHRFEWTRSEFQDWARRVAERYGYSVRFLSIGPEKEMVGPPTQMGVFNRG
jgi:3' terminal RNA ribose 2'-O-methyltransferase Hen1